MVQINPSNERTKRAYVQHLRWTDRKSEATIRGIEKALHRFEEHTGFADFSTFDRRQAMAFRDALAKPSAGGKPLGPATMLSTLAALQRFLGWLMLQPGMRRRIRPTDIDYLNLSAKEARAATASPSKPFPTIEQLRHVLAAMPSETEIERRDRAVFAVIMLTGARDNAVASLRLRHVDLNRAMIVQDPATVRTKASKLIESVFLPLGEEVERAFTDWVAYLRSDLLYGPDDPVFPQTATRIDPVRGPVAEELKRAIWSNAAPIRAIFKRAFTTAGLPYFSPHRVRSSIVEFAWRTCRTPEEFKAFSQNLGHSHVATTLASYGTIPLHRQRELVRNAGKVEDRDAKVDRLLAALEARLPGAGA